MQGIDLIFSIINLAIIVGLILFGFIKSIKPAIKHEIHNELEQVAHLKNERIDLIAQQAMLDQEIANQDAYCNQLKEKVALWREMFHKEKQKQAETAQHISLELDKKIEKQSQNYTVKKLQQQLASTVHATLEKDLIDYYSNPEHSEKYMQDLFRNLEPKTKSNA